MLTEGITQIKKGAVSEVQNAKTIKVHLITCKNHGCFKFISKHLKNCFYTLFTLEKEKDPIRLDLWAR